jgi:hypothetical protein
LIAQRHRLSAGCDRRCVGKRSRIDFAIRQRLDPNAFRVDDLEQGILRLHDLAGHHLGHGDHAVGRRAQELGLRACVANRLPTTTQAFKFGLGIRDLAPWHGVAFGERA